MFYNGTEKQQERMVYRLSDSFSKKQENPELELTVTVRNINAGNNKEILGRCKTLRDYMLYTDKVRTYAMNMPIEKAVEKAVTECIKEDILAEFLKKNRAEAMEVSIFEYNEELHLANLRREGYEEGLEHGITQGKSISVLELLDELGVVNDDLRCRISDQMQEEILSKWLKLAARVNSIQEFEELM